MTDLEKRIEELEREVERLKQQPRTYRPIFDNTYKPAPVEWPYYWSW